MKKKRVFKLMTAAGCALFAASTMGAASNVVSEDFESISGSISEQSGWTGYGTVTASNYTAAVAAVGTPINTAAKTKVLLVEGRVTCSNATTTATKPATVDMMVQVALPDDGLAFPANTTTEDIQIAVGVDTNAVANKGELKVYCKNRSDVVGWYSLGAVLDKDTWHRVSFTFDYANGLCQIRLDGDPLITGNGYFTSTDTTLSTGSWYKLANSTTRLTSVQVIGSTAIDELVVKHDTASEATVNDVLPAMADASTPINVNGVDVDKTWIEEQGITRLDVTNDAAAPDGSGMKISEKYRTGLSVSDGEVFAIKNMTMNGSTVTLTLPEMTARTGSNKIQYSTSATSGWTDADVTASGTVDIDVNPGSEGTPPAVIYVRLVNK